MPCVTSNWQIEIEDDKIDEESCLLYYLVPRFLGDDRYNINKD